MHINRPLLAAAVAAVVSAEVHVVDVGEEGLEFEPQTINPKKGDTVIFHLYPRHNVVSSTFDKPCESNDDSWFSGPFEETDNGKKKYVVNVTSEDPVCAHSVFQHSRIFKADG
jgi:plastocyanin